MKALEIPERFTGTVYICAWSNPDFCLYGETFVTDNAPNEFSECILLGQAEVDIALDRTGTLDKQVDQLRAARQKIIDKATGEAQQIQEAIESLLAIEMPEPVK